MKSILNTFYIYIFLGERKYLKSRVKERHIYNVDLKWSARPTVIETSLPYSNLNWIVHENDAKCQILYK